MANKVPTARPIQGLPRRPERDRRLRRAFQRNIPALPAEDPVEVGAVLSFPASDAPPRVGRRRK